MKELPKKAPKELNLEAAKVYAQYRDLFSDLGNKLVDLPTIVCLVNLIANYRGLSARLGTMTVGDTDWSRCFDMQRKVLELMLKYSNALGLGAGIRKRINWTFESDNEVDNVESLVE